MPDKPVAIVTAASKGIGAACARELAARGYALVLMSRTGAVEEIAGELGAKAVQGSVLEQGDIDRLVKTALDAHGRIDAVVNNTGHGKGSSTTTGRRYDAGARSAHLLDMTDDDWRDSFDIYMLGVVRMARAVTPVMQRQGKGAIVNISAFAQTEPSFAFPASSIRAAMAGFAKLYADRYGPDGIRMNGVLPGYLANYEWNDALIASIPLARAGGLDEIAKTVAFLLSDDAGYITGQSLLADGGVNRGA